MDSSSNQTKDVKPHRKESEEEEGFGGRGSVPVLRVWP